MKSRKGGAGRIILIAAVVIGIAAVALVLFFPADALKAQFERKISEATGYSVTTRSLGLGLSGFSLALRVKDLSAESADGSQRMTVSDLGAEVALLPLLGKDIKMRKLSGRGALLALGPPTRVVPARGAAVDTSPERGGALAAPDMAFTDGRITQAGDAGVTRFEGVDLTASFRSADGGGRLDGRFKADSTFFAPNASPDRPMRLPAIELAFGSDVTAAPLSALTRVEGSLGGWPVHGGVQSVTAGAEMTHTGDLEFDPVSINVLRGFLPPDMAGPVAVYEMDGSLETGQLHFETKPGQEAADYLFTARWTGAKASLPDKGRVVDNGTLSLELRPDDLGVAGDLLMGASKLNLNARLKNFAQPSWTATLRVLGPAADALRFMPPNADLNVTSGNLDMDLSLAGVVGRAGLPDMTGTIRISGMSLTHAAVPEPVERLDVSLFLAGTSLTIENGSVTAAGSDARFRGTLPDFRKPDLKLDVSAGTLDFSRLFPEAKGGSAQTPAANDGMKEPSVPVSGSLTIDRLVRNKLTLTGVTARYAMTDAGIDLTSITGGVYGGRATGDLHLKPAGKEEWAYDGTFFLDEVKAGEFLAAVSPVRGLEGTLRTGFSLSGRNGPGRSPLETLSLSAVGMVFDGALDNVPAVQKLATALNLRAGTAASIPFKTIRHRFRVEEGFVIMDTMNVAQATGDWKIGGRIGFDGRIDCPISTKLSPDMFTTGTDLRKLADLLADSEGRLPVSLRVTGTLASPVVSVDVEPLVQAAKEKAKDTLGDEIRKRLGGLLKKN